MEESIRKDDPLISAYRVHGIAYTRGVPVKEVLAELMGMLFELLYGNYSCKLSEMWFFN